MGADEVTAGGQRYSVSQRLLAPRSAWVGKVLVHPGSRGLVVVRHMRAESLRAWLDRRQAQLIEDVDAAFNKRVQTSEDG